MKYFYLLLFFLFNLSLCVLAQKTERINSGELIKNAITLSDSNNHKGALLLLNKISRSDTNYVWSLYERASNYEADSNYTLAVKYAQEGLALHEQREYEPDIYNIYGNILNEMGQSEKALQIFDEGISKYPAYSLLYFNKGVTLVSLKRQADAEAMFKKTLLINPYMYSAHFQLGYAALQQGKIVPAFLSFIGYLLANPSGRYAGRSIGLLDKIAKSTDDILELKRNSTATVDEAYQETEEILLSKIALDKSYKPIISIDDPISRQIQAVFEKMEYKNGSDDFWVQYYLPYYKQVFTQGKFEPFIFHIFSNVNLASVQEYTKKNKKDLDKLVNEAANYFDQIHATRELDYNKRAAITEKYFFDEGKLSGRGTLGATGKTAVGPWISFFPGGNKRAAGSYNMAGERDGVWKYYFYSGELKAIENYVSGKLNGRQDYYFDNGNQSSYDNYTNGVNNGLSNTYFYSGNIKSSVKYSQDKKQGEEKLFYSNGSLQATNNYVNGTLDGIAKEYFKNGKIKNTSVYAAGKAEGPYKSYYESGALSTEGQFSKDNAEGDWKFYFESGKIKERRHYLNNTEDGLHQEYFENGQLAVTLNEKKGKNDGEVIYYYKSGKPFSKYIYDNGAVRLENYTDSTGHQLYNAQIKGGSYNIVSYGFDGYKRSAVGFDSKGNLDGADTIFYSSGKVNQVNTYKSGELNGPSVTYYANGNKKSEINMTDGKADGYSTTYYANGKMQLEGWMQQGEHDGEWFSYDEKGRLTTREYYLNDELHGYKETFDPNGKKNLEEKYHLGWLEKFTQFDSTEKVIAVGDFPKASGKYVLIYPGGQVTRANYVNGDFDGAYQNFYFDGSTQSSYYYKKGLMDSTYTSYYHGGKKNTEGNFSYGNKTGVWKLYEEDGQPNRIINYTTDEVNGEKIYFDSGKKDFVAIYKDDELDGISKKYDLDGTLAYQTYFEESRALWYAYQTADGKLTAPIKIAAENGILKAFFSNGKPSRLCSYTNGVINGLDKVYYTNGQLRSEDNSAFGISGGASKKYYADGKLKSVYQYLNDNVEGVCREYYPNGNLQKEMTFDNGINNGPTKYYSESGKLLKTAWYYYGKLVSVKND